MTNMNEVYRCEVCGNITEVLFASYGDLVCCGQPMTLLTENTIDAATEKHVPVIEKTEEGVKVKVGEVAHPMEEKHHIQWIEIIADGVVLRKHLTAQDAPEAEFCTKADVIIAREYCNLHGHWRSK